MPRTLDEMLADARKRKETASTEEQVKIQGEIDALENVKREGVHTQSDLNKVDQQNRQALKEFREEVERTMGAPWEEVKQTLGNIEASITSPNQERDDSGKDQTDDATDLLGRVSGQLEAERNARLALERELRSNSVKERLNDTFKAQGLNESYLSPARRLIDYDDLVEKAMKREEITNEELQEKVAAVKEAAPVFFEKPPSPEDLYRGVPPSPDGGEPKQLTDAEREARSESVI